MISHRFQKNLKRMRLERKLTQTELAQRAGLCVAYISMLERGHRSPPLATLERLGEAFKVPPERLIQ